MVNAAGRGARAGRVFDGRAMHLQLDDDDRLRACKLVIDFPQVSLQTRSTASGTGTGAARRLHAATGLCAHRDLASDMDLSDLNDDVYHSLIPGPTSVSKGQY
eukprot:3583756-Prymnesium_polylepis.1